MWKVTSKPIPKNDFLASMRTKHSFRDALSAPLSKPTLSAAKAQLSIFSHMPKWVDTLMSIRNKIVKYFGFKVGTTTSLEMKKTDLKLGDAAGFMTVISVKDHEVISFAEDKHMQFYMSVTTDEQLATVSTLVNLKIPIGRLYMALITPFHSVIARAVIHGEMNYPRETITWFLVTGFLDDTRFNTANSYKSGFFTPEPVRLELYTNRHWAGIYHA